MTKNIAKKQTAMEKLLQCIKTNVGCRFALLFLSVPLGMLLLVVSSYCVNWLAACLNLGQDSRFIDSLSIIILGLPVFIVLWFFRTWDTKEQLAKSEEQINQNNYFQGLNNLFSKENIKVEIASRQLIALSKIVEKYKEDIQLAFIKRLKRSLNKEDGRYFSYAQYIVDWLSKNYHPTELDLNGYNFDYQEFKIETNFDILRNNEKNLEQLSFIEANLVGVNLSNAYLSEANLTRSDLREADLKGANLNGAILIGANLGGADLNGAKLNGADLRKANLHGRYLVETSLIGANLRETDLGETDLKGVYFGGANLKEVDLSGADLSKADLREAALNKANLNGANLVEVNLVEAYLEGADLRGANLSKANLSKVNVQKKDYQEARIYKTKFVGAIFNKSQHPIGIDFETLGYKLEDLVIGGINFCQLVNKNN